MLQDCVVPGLQLGLHVESFKDFYLMQGGAPSTFFVTFEFAQSGHWEL